MSFMLELLKKAESMTKHERIMRVIVLTCKKQNGWDLDVEEEFELNAIQTIREMNGELAKIRHDQELLNQ